MNTNPSAWKAGARPWAPAEQLDPETLQRTVEACAWLVGIAEESARSHGWNPGIVDWLNSMGSAAHELLQKAVQ